MNILAVDDERLPLNKLAGQLEIVFPRDTLRCEQEPYAALRWAEELAGWGETLDYAFLDIQLGSMDGLELAWRLKKIFPHTVLFFCTAYNQYALNAFGLRAKGYLIKPIRAEDILSVLNDELGDWRQAEPDGDGTPLPRVRVQAFGYFEVFVDGKPLVFERKKAKELLAYLVDRHGTSVTTEQMAAVLYEEENYDHRLKSRVTSASSSLQSTLKAAGAEDILVKSWGRLAIDPDKIKCDAYDFEKWDMAAVNAFHGEYMAGYSWAEFTTGKYVRMEQEQKNRRGFFK